MQYQTAANTGVPAITTNTHPQTTGFRHVKSGRPVRPIGPDPLGFWAARKVFV